MAVKDLAKRKGIVVRRGLKEAHGNAHDLTSRNQR